MSGGIYDLHEYKDGVMRKITGKEKEDYVESRPINQVIGAELFLFRYDDVQQGPWFAFPSDHKGSFAIVHTRFLHFMWAGCTDDVYEKILIGEVTGQPVHLMKVKPMSREKLAEVSIKVGDAMTRWITPVEEEE